MFFSRLLPMKTSFLSLRAKICNLIYETIEGHFTYWWVLLINTSLFDEHKETINRLIDLSDIAKMKSTCWNFIEQN